MVEGMRGREDPLPDADRRLLRVIDDAMAGAAARAGTRLACRPGCDECCHGPFPVNALDVRRLRRGMEELASRDPGRATAVIERVRAQIPRLAAGFPGDPGTGVLSEDENASEAFFDRHASIPCPALDPGTGRCDLYAHRPLTCRTFGPPVRIGGTDLPPCRLCFQGEPQAAVEACRVEIDPDGLEDRLVADRGEDEETVVAFALAALIGSGR
jgi:Fe-S-cluster containining protein